MTKSVDEVCLMLLIKSFKLTGQLSLTELMLGDRLTRYGWAHIGTSPFVRGCEFTG